VGLIDPPVPHVLCETDVVRGVLFSATFGLSPQAYRNGG
jgi:hypothetical protein